MKSFDLIIKGLQSDDSDKLGLLCDFEDKLRVFNSELSVFKDTSIYCCYKHFFDFYSSLYDV